PGNRTVTIDNFTPAGDSEFGRIRGLAPAEIDFECADTQDVNIRTGTGTVVANVLSTCPIRGALTLFGNSSATTVNVGNNGSIQNIRGALTIQSSQGLTALTVDNSSDAQSHSAVQLNQGSLTGLAPASISYGDQSLGSLTVRTGNGNNTITVTGTPRTGALNGGVVLTTGSGTNTVNVQGITAPLFIPPGTLLPGGPL